MKLKSEKMLFMTQITKTFISNICKTNKDVVITKSILYLSLFRITVLFQKAERASLENV